MCLPKTAVKFDIFSHAICWALVIMHCNKALYCMRTLCLEFLTSHAPFITILHNNRLYSSSDYISNYIQYIKLITAVP